MNAGRRWVKPETTPQASLFNSVRTGPLAAKADPISSKFAARHLISSGMHGRQTRAVLELVRAHPSLTSRELGALDDARGLDRYVVARRLSDLERRGLVVKESARTCSIGLRLAVVWTLTNSGAARGENASQ